MTEARVTSAKVFGHLRAAWCRDHTDADPSDRDIATVIARQDDNVGMCLDLIDRSGARTRVFTDQPLLPEEQEGHYSPDIPLQQTLLRLEKISTAYSRKGSRYVGDADVLAGVLDGLRVAYDVAYHPDQQQYGNWWTWRVGVPNSLNTICMLLYDEVPPDALDAYLDAIYHRVPGVGDQTGMNLLSAAGIMIRSGVLRGDAERIKAGHDGLAPVFTYAPLYDTDPVTYSGFYRDGSFLQHAVTPYNGGYGLEFLCSFTRLRRLLAGTEWDFTETERHFMIEQVERAYLPVIYNGELLDCVRGRYIARSPNRSHGTGHAALDAILQLADTIDTVDTSTAVRWRSIVRGQVERDTADCVVAHEESTPGQVARVKKLLADTSIRPAPEPVGHTLYASMDRAIHRRPGWACAIAMNSKRITRLETMRTENLHGFHTGSGMTYLYHDDGGHFDDAFWPTVDPYRLPGTTVDSQPITIDDIESGVPLDANWAGGAVIDGEFAVVGMDSEGAASSLRAKKSWFCLDDIVIALGAGITGGSGNPIATTVENRNLHAGGTNRLLIDGHEQPITQGWSEAFTSVSWAHIDGVGGYAFPGQPTLHALREERTGAWSDINTVPLHGSPPDPITRRYLTLWLDHGREPAGATYAYLLAPGATPARTAHLARTLAGAEILANTDTAQAIAVPRLALTAVNFFTPGRVGRISATTPCSVMLRQHAGRLTVAVAEPTQERTSVSLTLDYPGYRYAAGDDAISVQRVRPQIELAVHTQPRKAQGRTHTITFTATKPA